MDIVKKLGNEENMILPSEYYNDRLGYLYLLNSQ